MFHLSVKWSSLEQVFRVMRDCPQHTFLLLTKRPDEMRSFLEYYASHHDPILNVMPGVSAATQAELNARGPWLLRLQRLGWNTWLSLEPLVEAVDVRPFLKQLILSASPPDRFNRVPGIGAVVVGGETGKDARPLHPDWVRAARDACQEAQVSFEFKSWGSLQPITRTDGVQEMPFGDYNVQTRWGFIKKRLSGCVLDGVEYHWPEKF